MTPVSDAGPTGHSPVVQKVGVQPTSEDLGATLAGSTLLKIKQWRPDPRITGDECAPPEIWAPVDGPAQLPMSEFGAQIFPVAPNAL